MRVCSITKLIWFAQEPPDPWGQHLNLNAVQMLSNTWMSMMLPTVLKDGWKRSYIPADRRKGHKDMLCLINVDKWITEEMFACPCEIISSWVVGRADCCETQYFAV